MTTTMANVIYILWIAFCLFQLPDCAARMEQWPVLTRVEFMAIWVLGLIGPLVVLELLVYRAAPVKEDKDDDLGF